MDHLEKIIRLADLPQFVGLKRTQIQEMIKRGEFPTPVRLSARRIAWLESEVVAWQQKQIAARNVAKQTVA